MYTFMDAIKEVLKGSKTTIEVSRQFGVNLNLVMELIRQRDGTSPMEDRKRPYPLSKFKGNGTERKCGKCGRSVATIDLCDRGHSYCDSCWHEYEGLFGWYEATEWYAETPCPECVREDFGGGEVLRLTNPQEDLL